MFEQYFSNIFNIVTDLSLFLIVALIILIGTKTGFLKILSKPVCFVGSILTAWYMCKPFGERFIAPLIRNPIVNSVTAFLSKKGTELTAENAYDHLPSMLKLAAGLCGIDVSQVAAEADGNIAPVLVERLTNPLISLVSWVLSFVVLYLVATVVFSVLFAVVNAVASRGPIGVINRFFGFIISLFTAAIVLWLIVAGLQIIFTNPDFVAEQGVKGFNGGLIYGFVSSHSLIDIILSF